MADVEGFEAISNHFRSTLEVAIKYGYGGYTGLSRYQLAQPSGTIVLSSLA
jgi:hypothetical protein